MKRNLLAANLWPQLTYLGNETKLEHDQATAKSGYNKDMDAIENRFMIYLQLCHRRK